MRRLRKTWWIATSSLLIAIILFLLSLYVLKNNSQSDLWLALKAFSEAAMVGALADWFAIVALFRHPLGIPIPHTAVLVRGKERVAQAIARFVSENFLTPEVLLPKIQKHRPSYHFAQWLAQRGNADKILSLAINFAPSLRRFFQSDGIKKFFRDNLTPLILSFPLHKTASIALRNLKDTPVADTLVGKLSEEALSFVRDNKDDLERQVAANLPIPSFRKIPFLGEIRESIAALIAPLIMDKVEKYLLDVSREEAHPLRLKIKDRMTFLADKLDTDASFANAFENAKNTLLASDTLDIFVTNILSALQKGILDEMLSPGSRHYRRTVLSLARIGRSLRNSPAVLEKMDATFLDLISKASTLYHDRIADEIRLVVLSWDSNEMIAKIEEQVGDDLQFIRLNGTLVGGSIGLVLFWITYFI